jgi:hypothetical protein
MRAQCGECGVFKSCFLPTKNPKKSGTGAMTNRRLRLNAFELPELKFKDMRLAAPEIAQALNSGNVKQGGELCSAFIRKNNPNPKDRRVFSREGGSIASALYKAMHGIEPVGNFDNQRLVEHVMGKVLKHLFVKQGGALTLPRIKEIIQRAIAKAKPHVKAIAHAATKGTRENWPPSSRAIFEKYGELKIQTSTFRVCRHPISTDGFVKKLTAAVGRKMPHDKLFHLLMVFKLEDGTELFLEKNEDLRVGKAQIKYETKKDMNCIPIQYKGSEPVTLNNLVEKTQKRMGDRFFRYSSFQNNCQDFIVNVMDANSMSGDRQFIKQDVEDLLPRWMQKVADVGTDIKNVRNLVTEGFGNPLMQVLNSTQ